VVGRRLDESESLESKAKALLDAVAQLFGARHWLVFPVRQDDSDPAMVQQLHAVLQLLALAQAPCK
jgi:hypothetical protein